MTDSEMNALEKRLSARPIESPWNEQMYYEARLLELIRDFRQVQAERDALINYIVEHGGCHLSIWEKCPYEQNETPRCNECWLKATKEAVCHKK